MHNFKDVPGLFKGVLRTPVCNLGGLRLLERLMRYFSLLLDFPGDNPEILRP